MDKPKLTEIEDMLDFLHYNCPNEVYDELIDCDCHEVDGCCECWAMSIYQYKKELRLKNKGDNEKEEE